MHTFRGVHSMVCDFETNIFASLSFAASRGINTLKNVSHNQCEQTTL